MSQKAIQEQSTRMTRIWQPFHPRLISGTTPLFFWMHIRRPSHLCICKCLWFQKCSWIQWWWPRKIVDFRSRARKVSENLCSTVSPCRSLRAFFESRRLEPRSQALSIFSAFFSECILEIDFASLTSGFCNVSKPLGKEFGAEHGLLKLIDHRKIWLSSNTVHILRYEVLSSRFRI